MCNSKPLINIIFLCALFYSANLAAQDSTAKSTRDSTEVNVQQKGKYAFVLYAGGGMFSYLSSVGSSSGGTGINSAIMRHHGIGTFRVMWHPDHRLRIGLESGYTNFYSYELKNGNKTGTVSLTAIPILFVWSMAITKRLNVFAGVGSYFMTTHLHYDSKVTSGALGLGFNVSVNYIQPVSSKFGIGAEIKWTEATQTRDYGLSAHLMLEWKFFEW